MSRDGDSMEDRFFEIINSYLLPLKACADVMDSTYFLRRNLSFAFAQGYCHPAGGFYGKLINYPDPGGRLSIFGRPYSNTNKRLVNGSLELIPIQEQLELHFLAEPALMRREGFPPFAEFHAAFRLEDCIGWFEHAHSLQVAMRMYPKLRPKVERLRDFFGLPEDRFGTTGSLAYGRLGDDEEGEDIDLTIRGSLEEHRRARRAIEDWIAKDSSRRVCEFGKFWPMRFYLDGTLICPFFIYGRREEIPLADFHMDLLREGVRLRGRVSDDAHAVYLPVVLGMDGASLDGEPAGEIPLIIYDSSMRGEFARGDIIEGRVKLVRVRTPRQEYRALLATDGARLRSERSACRTPGIRG